MFADNKAEIGFKYIMTSYFIALVWISAIIIPVLLAKYQGGYVGGFSAIYYVVFSGVLFPFARIAYDIPIGFKLNDKVEHSSLANLPMIIGFLFFMYLLVLFFSVFLAPFGCLYLIVKGLQYHEQIIKRLDQESREKEVLKKEVIALREEIVRQDKSS